MAFYNNTYEKPKRVDIPPPSIKRVRDMDIENLRCCPLCGKDMKNNEIHLCGDIQTLVHNCISDIQIKIAANTDREVARKWNTFVTVTNR